MKIRVMGTMPECQKAKDYYSSLRGQESGEVRFRVGVLSESWKHGNISCLHRN